MRREAWLGMALAMLVTSVGCEKPPPAGVTRIMDLPMASTEPPDPAMDEPIRSWQSAPWTGADWIPYPGRAVLDIDHGLDRVPQGVLVYISFTQDGMDPALAPGDLAQVRSVDADRVVIWNNTNGAYFARVVVF
jgi:hypothetical protein